MEVDPKTGIIYCWRNVHNGKRYIGQTINPKKRYNEHKRHLGNYDGQNHFYRAMNKYSSMDDWEYTVIEEVSKDMLDRREIHWIAFYDSMNPTCGYNSTPGGDRRDGFIHSEESRKKMSESIKGRKHSEAHRKKISQSLKGKNTWTTGRKHSEESRKKMSIAKQGKHPTEETREKISTSKNPNKIAVYQNDSLIVVCDTLVEAGHIANVSIQSINQIIRGKCHKTSNGYAFKYIPK